MYCLFLFIYYTSTVFVHKFSDIISYIIFGGNQEPFKDPWELLESTGRL